MDTFYKIEHQTVHQLYIQKQKILIMKKLIAIIVLTIVFQSCEKQKVSEVTKPQIDNSASIVVLIDKSLSVQDFGIPAMKLNDFDELIQYVSQNSGVLAVGSIGKNSDKVMVTLTIEKPPIAPEKPRLEDYKSTVFLNKDNEYKNKSLPEYEAKKDKWNSVTTQKIQRFKSELEILLNQPYNELYTDIFNGLNRASVIHQSSKSKQNLSILVSDGIDDVGNTLRDITSDVALVYGSEKYDKRLDKLPKFKRYETLEMVMQILK